MMSSQFGSSIETHFNTLERVRERVSVVDQAGTLAVSSVEKQTANWNWYNALSAFKKAVMCRQSFSKFEQAGLLLTASMPENDVANPVEQATDTVSRLYDLNEKLKTPGTPVLRCAFDSPSQRSSFGIFRSAGEGLGIKIGDDSHLPQFEIVTDFGNDEDSFIGSQQIEPELLLSAMDDTDERRASRAQILTKSVVFRSDVPCHFLIVGEESLSAFVETLLSVEGPDEVTEKAQARVFEIWRGAKKIGTSLEKDNQKIAEWLKEAREETAEKLAQATVARLRENFPDIETRTAIDWNSMIESDDVAAALGVQAEMVQEKAVAYNKSSYEAIAEKIEII